jgi:hypothetical protein
MLLSLVRILLLLRDEDEDRVTNSVASPHLVPVTAAGFTDVLAGTGDAMTAVAATSRLKMVVNCMLKTARIWMQKFGLLGD